MYYVNRSHTYPNFRIHEEGCSPAEERHGPFDSKNEAIAAAHALAVLDVASCTKCGGAGELTWSCPCARCASEGPGHYVMISKRRR